MSRNLIVKENGRISYPILIEYGFEGLHDVLRQLEPEENRVCIITDDNIGPHYLNEVMEIVKAHSAQAEFFTIAAGEEYKNLDTVNRLYEKLIQCRFDRDDVLIALGGGVVGDLTGFTAATYLRGIRFVQIPTSLLAMVDSSIGGKTGVDFLKYKNMVGAFYQPRAVYINLTALNTLTKRQYISGFGEVIKYGLIRDEKFYAWLRENREKLHLKNLSALEEVVYKSLSYKQEIVEVDPDEKGIRALLNFGHTVGHAVEKLMDFQLLHGECVAVGMAAALRLSQMRGYLTSACFEEICNTMKEYGLPISVRGLAAKDILDVTKNDKKMKAGKIKFILLNPAGNAVIDDTVTNEELLQAISYVLQE